MISSVKKIFPKLLKILLIHSDLSNSLFYFFATLKFNLFSSLLVTDTNFIQITNVILKSKTKAPLGTLDYHEVTLKELQFQAHFLPV